jgi:hypothetical protein
MKESLRGSCVIDQARNVFERDEQPKAVLFDADGVLTLAEEKVSLFLRKFSIQRRRKSIVCL